MISQKVIYIKKNEADTIANCPMATSNDIQCPPRNAGPVECGEVWTDTLPSSEFTVTSCNRVIVGVTIVLSGERDRGKEQGGGERERGGREQGGRGGVREQGGEGRGGRVRAREQRGRGGKESRLEKGRKTPEEKGRERRKERPEKKRNSDGSFCLSCTCICLHSWQRKRGRDNHQHNAILLELRFQPSGTRLPSGLTSSLKHRIIH